MITGKLSFAPRTLQAKELSFKGTHTYVRDDFDKAVELLASGKIDFDRIITQHYPIDRIAEAMDDVEKRNIDCVKVMIDF